MLLQQTDFINAKQRLQSLTSKSLFSKKIPFNIKGVDILFNQSNSNQIQFTILSNKAITIDTKSAINMLYYQIK